MSNAIHNKDSNKACAEKLAQLKALQARLGTVIEELGTQPTHWSTFGDVAHLEQNLVEAMVPFTHSDLFRVNEDTARAALRAEVTPR